MHTNQRHRIFVFLLGTLLPWGCGEQATESGDPDGGSQTRTVGDPPAGAPCKRVTDHLGRPNTSNIDLQYIYDTDGNLWRAEMDFDQDGSINWTVTYTYNEAGELLVEDRDYGANGSIDEHWVYAYTAGKLSQKEWRDQTQNDKVYERHSYIYDASGRLSAIEYDIGWADGTADHRRSYTYNAAGQIETETFDSDVNGSPDILTTYIYADGKLTRTEQDTGVDQELDEIRHFFYNANGLLVEEHIDWDADGTIDTEVSYLFSCPFAV